MRKIEWGDFIGFLACLFVFIVSLLNDAIYDDFVKTPFDHGSGTTGSRLWYLMMHKIDQYIGKVGLLCFFVGLGLFFLLSFFRENWVSIKNRYRDYIETGDWRKLFGK
jgi:hypothetical protein